MNRITKNNHKFLEAVYINNLNTIQSIISRLSKIGITIFSVSLTIFSIMFPLILSLNIPKWARCFLCLSLIIIQFCFFISHLINLKNERIWIQIYEEKSKLNIADLQTNNNMPEILKNDFNSKKKFSNIRWSSLLKSWWSLCWFIIILLLIITNILIIFI
ncbi:Uncharacterised protein [Metamycoplasma cloacale]|nr:Uncharacterised protein [Metamycoplasma cloacale]